MLVEHHIKYKEIHGIDETVWIEAGAHKSLHCKLRKEGKCKVPVEILRKISRRASFRTDKMKKWIKDHSQKAYQILTFTEGLDIDIRLRERIIYNSITGNVQYLIDFRGFHGKKICTITEK